MKTISALGNIKAMRGNNVEIKIDKKFFISIGAVLALCFASFCAGRHIRFSGASRASEQLISRVISAGDDANTISNCLSAAGYSAKSAAAAGQLIASVFGEMRKENEQLRVSINEAQRAAESNKRVTELVDAAYTKLSNTTGDAIDIAIEHAEQYEQLIKSLRQALGDTTENN